MQAVYINNVSRPKHGPCYLLADKAVKILIRLGINTKATKMNKLSKTRDGTEQRSDEYDSDDVDNTNILTDVDVEVVGEGVRLHVTSWEVRAWSWGKRDYYLRIKSPRKKMRRTSPPWLEGSAALFDSALWVRSLREHEAPGRYSRRSTRRAIGRPVPWARWTGLAARRSRFGLCDGSPRG
jgi:hypothetical protein